MIIILCQEELTLKKKSIYIIAIIICLFLIATFVLLFLISPGKSLTIPKPEKYNTLDDFSKDKFQQALNGVKDSKKLKFILTFSESELNDVFSLFYDSNKDNYGGLKKIKGFKFEITDKKINLYANANYFGPFIAGLKIGFTPTIENNKIVLKIEESSVGAISIPNSIPLSLLKSTDNSYFSIGKDNSSITLTNSIPKEFELDKIYIKDSKINLEVNVSINSSQDVLDILSEFLK